MSSTRRLSALASAHLMQTPMSIATMGVLLRKAERQTVGAHSRISARECEVGAPRRGAASSATAPVRSSAAARTKSVAMVRIEGEEKPRHAWVSSITPTSSKITVPPRKTRSGGASNACVARGDACVPNYG